MKRFHSKSVWFVGCAAFAIAAPAAAQEAAEEEENVILVTAQNRAQDVQDVPIAIDVVGADELAAAGFNSANDLSAIAPAVQVNQDQGTVKITLRGIGTTSNDEAQDTSVVANIDGEYINRPNVLGIALFDLDRVEVLRGPQGTLYGRNSTAGAINFITRRPDDEFGVNASLSYGLTTTYGLTAGSISPWPTWAACASPVSSKTAMAMSIIPLATASALSRPLPVAVRTPMKRRADARHCFSKTAALPSRSPPNMPSANSRPQAFAFADLNTGNNAPRDAACGAPGYSQFPVRDTTKHCAFLRKPIFSPHLIAANMLRPASGWGWCGTIPGRFAGGSPMNSARRQR